MKAKSKIIMVLFCVYLALIKFIPRLDYKFDIDYYIFVIALIIGVCCICLIPKRIFGILLAALVTIGVSVYQYHYCIYSLPVLFLVCAHKEALSENQKGKKIKKKNYLSEMYSLLSLLCIVPQFMYAQKYETNVENSNTIGDFGYIICFLILFIMLFIASFGKGGGAYNNSIKKDIANKFRLIYLATIICICVAVYTLAMKAEIRTIVNEVEFVYWFVFVVVIILNKDPFLNVLMNKFEVLTTREKSKNKVKK